MIKSHHSKGPYQEHSSEYLNRNIIQTLKSPAYHSWLMAGKRCNVMHLTTTIKLCDQVCSLLHTSANIILKLQTHVCSSSSTIVNVEFLLMLLLWHYVMVRIPPWFTWSHLRCDLSSSVILYHKTCHQYLPRSHRKAFQMYQGSIYSGLVCTASADSPGTRNASKSDLGSSNWTCPKCSYKDACHFVHSSHYFHIIHMLLFLLWVG